MMNKRCFEVSEETYLDALRLVVQRAVGDADQPGFFDHTVHRVS